eukprot:CAMPEP_0115282870 /NCGR_PEP_ID=MMETSP0270-20121206/60072_1 /TAXON_ID=71861 /ORGANISM="Scrippsiella trochoidea, Strain CCMP3099" /LENGTH=198 /DNA_ID=CAMNT_0002699743 /DNA_START=68 /DNA_END=664 /DNA_ORIENTATION=+
MSTWTGAILGGTVGVLQGVVVGTAAKALGGNFSEGYGMGQQVWMSMGDVAQSAIINYDAVEPGSVQNGDMMVMWSNKQHTILVLVVNSKRFAVYEHCGTYVAGIGDRGGPVMKELTGDDAWKNLRNHRGSHNYICHHIKANETKDHLDQVFERLKPKYQGKYDLAFNNCHSFVDDMLVTMGYHSPGLYRTAAARARNL